jgi:hypothetical protein
MYNTTNSMYRTVVCLQVLAAIIQSVVTVMQPKQAVIVANAFVGPEYKCTVSIGRYDELGRSPVTSWINCGILRKYH